MTDLREKMIEYRAKENISQIVMAERCNVHPNTIYGIENGKQKPSRLTEAKIRRVIEEEE